jgi:hypothetical protein
MEDGSRTVATSEACMVGSMAGEMEGAELLGASGEKGGGLVGAEVAITGLAALSKAACMHAWAIGQWRTFPTCSTPVAHIALATLPKR